MSDLEEQLNVLSIQRDQLALELSKRKEHMEHNSIGMRNLQLALEQLQRGYYFSKQLIVLWNIVDQYCVVFFFQKPILISDSAYALLGSVIKVLFCSTVQFPVFVHVSTSSLAFRIILSSIRVEMGRSSFWKGIFVF